MKVVILCGGIGTRLREETEFRPKPMVEIGSRPILWHIMKGYSHYGFRDFVLCLGYRGNMIKDYFLNYEAMSNDFTIRLGRRRHVRYHQAHTEQDFHVTLADTGLETMTGGRIRRVRPYVGAETFMATYGDGLADINIRRLLRFHKSHGKLATVTTVRTVSRFGMVTVNKKGAITRFAEKPQIAEAVSAGFFVFEPQIFNYLTGDSCILEREPMESLARQGQLMAYPHEGFFYAMDTYREYQHLNQLWASGETPWKVWKT